MRLSLGARPPRSAGGEGCCGRADAVGKTHAAGGRMPRGRTRIRTAHCSLAAALTVMGLRHRPQSGSYRDRARLPQTYATTVVGPSAAIRSALAIPSSSCLPFARPCERKARGAGYRKCTSYCGRRPHHRGCVRLRQPCSITVAAALWPVAQTHDSQCCGERAVSGAYARPAPRHPPACSVCLANGIRPPAATFAAGASRRPRAQ